MMSKSILAVFALLVSVAATLFAQSDVIRFTAADRVVEMRVEVYGSGGQPLYDSQWKSGNLLDWPLTDGFGRPLPFGSYQVVVMSRQLGGEMGKRQATLQVHPEGVTLEGQENESPRMALLAHDGTTGQLITTEGDLSFRFGDFLNRKDTEAMRLSPEGNLDVKGWIRPGQGIVFPDGSAVTSAASLMRIRASRPPEESAEAKLHPKSDVTGTGLPNQVTKWLDTAGTLVDSAINEVGGAVKIGTNTAQGQLQIAGAANQDIFSGMGPNIVAGPAMNYGYAGQSFGVGAGFFNVRPAMGATGVNPSLRLMTINVERMIITNAGNVGIGTSAPGQKLDVNGGIRGSGAITAGTQFNLDGFRILTGDGSNLFAGFSTGGANTTGNQNVYVGASAGATNTTGCCNSFFGYSSGFWNGGTENSYFGSNSGENVSTGSGNSAFGKSAGAGIIGGANTGANNSFFGSGSGSGVQTGSDNAAFGASSAPDLTTGFKNSFFGANSGNATTTGSHNTYVGYHAGFDLTTESNNTMLGYAATGAATATDATAIGHLALVEQSHSLVLGSINGKNGAVDSTNVGIGTTTPAETLHVAGGKVRWSNSLLTDDQNGSVELGGTDTIAGGIAATPYIDFHGQNAVAEDYNVRLMNDGNHNLHIIGSLAVENLAALGTIALCQNALKQIATCTSSSIRYKDSIATFGRGLDVIRRLRPVTFRWKQDGKPDLGLIAEEVEKVEPLLTVYNAKGQIEGVKYDHLTVALINAVQEQQSRLDGEQRKADELRNENTLLRARLERVELALQDLTTKRPISH
jgi:hypothetical protein